MHRAIGAARHGQIRAIVRVFRCCFLIDVRAETGSIGDVQIAVFECRRARQDFVNDFREEDHLLYPEVRQRKIEMHIRCVRRRAV